MNLAQPEYGGTNYGESVEEAWWEKGSQQAHGGALGNCQSL